MRNPNRLRVVGERLAAQDGPAKVKGTAIFTADRTLPGMLHAKVLRSPHAHARIRRINVARAAQHPGVHAVVTGRDLAGLDAVYADLNAPAAGKRILGVIVPMPEQSLFFKMIGPADLVGEQKRNFDAFIRSFRLGADAGN